MKSLALIVLLFFSIEVCHTQLPGAPLIEHSSIWYFQQSAAYFDISNCGQNFAFVISDFTYSIEGDTVMNDATYLKMYIERRDSTYCSNNPSINWTSSSSGFLDYIREDQNRLLVYDENENEEIVIHDYSSIEIGDSLSFDCVVGSIDTLFLLQQPYLKYNCDCNSEFLIQGIGTKRSLFANLNCGTGIEGDLRNLCYSKNGFTIKVDSISNCIATGDTSLYVSTNEVLSINEYSIYPNPTYSQLTVKVSGNTELKNYSLYTFEGKEVIRSRAINSQKTVISLSNIVSGIYFLVVEVGDGRIIRDKIVVLN